MAAVWSKKMPLAHVGAVLSLFDGVLGSMLCGVGFGLFVGTLPTILLRLYCLLGHFAGGCPGHGPVHLLVESAGVLGFTLDPLNSGSTWPGLPMLHHLAGPFQNFQAANWDAWRSKEGFDLCRRQGFGEGPMLDIAGSLQLLRVSHVGERDKALLRSIMVGGVWNVCYSKSLCMESF